MFCKNCGKELPEGTRVCDECGTSVAQPTPVKAPSSGKGTASLVLGIIGLVACWIMPLLGYAIGIPGLIISIKEMRNGNKETKVILGLVFSIICLVISVAIHILNTIALMNGII